MSANNNREGVKGGAVTYEGFTEVFLRHDVKTLRDEFAIAALTGILARSSRTQNDEAVAEDAYEIADAMLEARKAKL